MLRAMLEARSLVAMIVATAVGVGGLHAYPFPREHVFLELIAPLMTSVLAILASQSLPPMRPRPLPRYPVPEQQPTTTVVLGEAHFASVPGQASGAGLADDPATRPLYRRDNPRGRRDWEDLHPPRRPPAATLDLVDTARRDTRRAPVRR